MENKEVVVSDLFQPYTVDKHGIKLAARQNVLDQLPQIGLVILEGQTILEKGLENMERKLLTTYCKGISAFPLVNNLYIILDWVNCNLIYCLGLKYKNTIIITQQQNVGTKSKS